MLFYKITFGLITMISMFCTIIYGLDSNQQYSSLLLCSIVASTVVWVILVFINNGGSVYEEVSALIVFVLVTIFSGLMLFTETYQLSNRYLVDIGLIITSIYIVGSTLCSELISSTYFFKTEAPGTEN